MRWPSTRAVRTVAAGSAAAIVVAALRSRSLRWGATDEELNTALPGDELVPHADLTATRAVTVHAGADGVWPWIAQLGQGRGGFYSYDVLENLVGLTSTAPTGLSPNGRASTSATKPSSIPRAA
jgi:hypothetical protein